MARGMSSRLMANTPACTQLKKLMRFIKTSFRGLISHKWHFSVPLLRELQKTCRLCNAEGKGPTRSCRVLPSHDQHPHDQHHSVHLRMRQSPQNERTLA